MTHNFKMKILPVLMTAVLAVSVIGENTYAQTQELAKGSGAETNAAPSAMFETAKKLVEASEFKAAIKQLVAAQKNGEDTIGISLLLSEAYAGRIDQVGALKQMKLAKKIKASLEHTLELDPTNLDAMEGLVEFHMQAPSIVGGDKTAARAFIEKVKVQAPARGHLRSGLLETVNGQYAKAFESFEACLVIKPEHKDCLYQLGKASQVGDLQLEKGKKAFETFIAKYPDDVDYTPHAYFRLGHIHTQMDDDVSAKVSYEAAVKMSGHKGAKEILEKP